jgi:Domain of unknown function (DUF4265)
VVVGNADLLKVAVQLESGAWHGHALEKLWAERVGDGRYRLRNTPFYAKGLSFEDVVFAEVRADGQLVVSGVSLYGGHSTYRLAPKASLEDVAFRSAWAPLQATGCSFEGVGGRLLAVDVPPQANIQQVYDLLQRGEDDGVWEFEEGHCGHSLSAG